MLLNDNFYITSLSELVFGFVTNCGNKLCIIVRLL